MSYPFRFNVTKGYSCQIAIKCDCSITNSISCEINDDGMNSRHTSAFSFPSIQRRSSVNFSFNSFSEFWLIRYKFFPSYCFQNEKSTAHRVEKVTQFLHFFKENIILKYFFFASDYTFLLYFHYIRDSLSDEMESNTT